MKAAIIYSTAEESYIQDLLFLENFKYSKTNILFSDKERLIIS